MKQMLRTAVLLVPLVLAGCSSTFAYNNLDWLLYWYLDDYVDLQRDQKQVFDQQLDTWLQWHRAEELGAYRNHLNDLREDLSQPHISAETLLAHMNRGRGHWERFRDRIVPGLAEFSPRLSDEQVNQLFDELEEQNRKNEQERYEGTEQERQAQRVEDLQDQVKGYIGRLTDSQKVLIAEHAPLFESSFDGWIQYRRQIQAKARALFDARHDNPAFVAELKALMLDPDQEKSDEYVAISNRNRARFAQLASQLHDTLTDKQRKRLLGEIDDLIDDLTTLIEDD
ncbi:DUF6279 family lipoprotein [Aestuariibacter halophilus]|uniref:DUF6279 family lipoprotein n=1 Tax=Fluctibacter halophilus TaxID=226011 RepID=A0ABS8G6Y1_9ALTE|nr:DUF6279 family lipoprotein [Aestuariibacter halophilus]MCC2615444.1 DUF6279 family lipoprotein [Aestuariibacter halophilus]